MTSMRSVADTPPTDAKSIGCRIAGSSICRSEAPTRLPPFWNRALSLLLVGHHPTRGWPSNNKVGRKETVAMAAANVLVTTDWLANHLTDPSIAVVEVDEDTSAYLSGHIPGAAGLDWKKELHDLPRRDFVSSEQLAALLGEKASPRSRPSSSMGATRTGSRPTPTGWENFEESNGCRCSTAAG